MSTLNFPTSPSLNDTYTFGTKTWIWNGTGWQLSTNVSSSINNIVIGNITPASGAFTTLTANSTISAVGNISGAYFIGNGSQLTGLPEGYANANVAAYLPTYTGNLASLEGNVTTTANVSASYVLGNGSALTSLTGANVTGQVPNALVSGTVYTAAQPNITSVGTLSSLSVSGNITGGNISATRFFNGTSNISISGANGNVTISANSVANIATITGTGVNVAGTLNATGNLTAANIIITGNTITAPMDVGGATTGRLTFVSSVANGTVLQIASNTASEAFSGLASWTKRDTGNATYAFYAVNGTGAYVETGKTGTGTAPTKFDVIIQGTTYLSVSNTVSNITGNLNVTGNANANIVNANTAVYVGPTIIANSVSALQVKARVGQDPISISHSDGVSYAALNFYSNANIQVGTVGTGNPGASFYANQAFFWSSNGLALSGNGYNTAGGTKNMFINSSGLVTVPGSTAATTTTSGAFQVTGGVGVGGNIYAGGLVSVTGNVTGGNISTGGQVSVTGNITGGNISTAGHVAAATLQTTGNAIIGGDLVVNGNTIQVNIDQLNVQDPIIGLGRGANNAPLTTNDGKDRGTEMWYYTDAEQSAFVGYQNSTGNIIAASNVSMANEIVTVNSYGNFVTGNVIGATVSASGNISGAYILGNGSQLTGLPESYTNANVEAYLPTYTGNLVSLTGNVTTTANISANYVLGNGSQLTGLPVPATTTFSATAPASPAQGDIWIDADSGIQYIYFNDGTSSQWAEMEAQTSVSSGPILSAITESIVPAADVTYDLGSATYRWRDIYLSGNTINLGGATIKTDAGSGAIALIPEPTESNPNPSGMVVSPSGGITVVATTGGEVSGNAIANAAASPTASPVPIDIITTPPINGQALIWDAYNAEFVPGNVSAGGEAATTTVYANISNLPLSNVATGSMAFVSSNNRLYLWNGTGWFNIALINTNPTITVGPEATYEFATDGTPIVVSLTASDPEGIPITWGYEVTAGTLGNTAAVSQTGNVFTFTPSTDEANAGTFEITFSASDGVNIDTAASEFTLAFAVPPGQQAFTTPGTSSFVVPDGVSTICAVLIGAGATGSGGGGAGGSLRWINNLPVTPGETLTVFVGAGGGYGSTGPTTIKRGTDTLILASSNNSGGYWNTPEIINPSTAVGAGPFGGTVGGGNGGAGGGASSSSGGGGAGGYSGNGGAGGANGSGGSSGAGGGAAGGNSSNPNDNIVGGAGGGTGIYGEGSSGTTSRAGGSGGAAGADGGYRSPAQGGSYGGGGGGTNGYYNGYSSGGNGAARIIWGANRAFPSTNTQDM